MIIQTVDDRRKLYVFDAVRELVEYAVSEFIHVAEESIGRRGSFCVALSGGSTPKAFLQALTSSERAKMLPWGAIHIFWSDERAVAPDHTDSNYGMAMHYFAAAPFSEAHFYRMQAERSDRDLAATEYEEQIRKIRPDGDFDIIYLGLGEDGHTASLFPGSSAVNVQDRLVVATYVEAKSSWRMTFTIPLINQAHHIVVFVVSESKASIVKQVLTSRKQPLFPAEYIGTKETCAQFFSDRLAATLCMS